MSIFFCSNKCKFIYGREKKTWGCNVSKLERYIQENLIEFYPDIRFDFNKHDAINGELDIYLPDFNLAFELNGIFHYEPIFGADKLNKTQNNDKRKFQACLERGIELVIIDASSLKVFKDKSAKVFLDIICGIIDYKVSSKEEESKKLSSSLGVRNS